MWSSCLAILAGKSSVGSCGNRAGSRYAGKGRFITEQVDLSGMVRDVVLLLKSSVPKTVDLNIDLPRNLPTVEANPGQMQQLIMNLVINAGEAIGEGHPGTIEIRTGKRDLTVEEIRESFVSEALRPGLYVWLQVKDTGVGMDETTRAKIFDPFFTTKFTGRGLGLAAVSSIVRALGGGFAYIARLARVHRFMFWFRPLPPRAAP